MTKSPLMHDSISAYIYTVTPKTAKVNIDLFVCGHKKRRGFPRLFLFLYARTELAVALLEVLHEVDQNLDAGDREGVVDRGADTADRAVSLELLHAGL